MNQFEKFVNNLPADVFCSFLEAIQKRIENDPSVLNLSTSERVLLEKGDIISAIKSVRARTGLGLRDSKDICDKYIRIYRGYNP